ncbi:MULTISPECIES: hypothetical protein [unclassified Mucilaginibacter]|uniref:hypothetical protein n=1 Tax=unclassified Mucilaginibacter TaxID=2617802 RepID=UPI002AC8D8B7|nr:MULTISPECIES: hypothetical protein [unclassified Mucilaginibacter]MEB0262278.1 hypothetical protein [Mucilaginibacter sp. 10I4]MEB0277098.1 hypothetical protein [Mucilaginibacter sp. 10B2]MEB0301836.1 hypothetical protein [Mucilaginibacter sp. 5C4]WPX25198.1 hypothetical protein RHM67_07955 [Mucilaginibacter sp. 5C4]
MGSLAFILSSVLGFIFGAGLTFLGAIALKSPERITNFNLRIVRRLNYLSAFKLKENYILKAENGYYTASWKKAGWPLIIMGGVFLFALVIYWKNL